MIKTQRLGARLILRAWKSVSLPVLEAKASLESTDTRLDKKTSAYTAKTLTVGQDHLMKKALTFRRNQCRLKSPLQQIMDRHIEQLRPKGQTRLQSSVAWAKPPWISFEH